MTRFIKVIVFILLFLLIIITTDYILYKNNKNPFFAINTVTYYDGGSKEFLGIGYKVVRCNTLSNDKSIHFGFYNINVDGFCNNLITTHTFKAKIISIENDTILIKPNPEEKESLSSDLFSITIDKDTLYDIGTEIIVTYQGGILESYPAQIDVIQIEIID